MGVPCLGFLQRRTTASRQAGHSGPETMADTGGEGLVQWLVDLVMKPGTSLQLVRVKSNLREFLKGQG